MTRWEKRREAVDRLITRTCITSHANFRQSAKQFRDRAMACLIRKGLTTGQICRLDIGDVDLVAGLIYAKSQRIGYVMPVEMDRVTMDALRKWLSVRDMAARTTALFVSLHSTDAHRAPGERISQRGVCAMLAQRSMAE